MAITDAYATAAEYRTTFGVTNTSGVDADAVILADITSVSRYLDRRLGRFFTKDASVVARRYQPSGRPTLNVHDIASLTGLIVKVDDDSNGIATTTLTITTDFEVAPLDADKGPEPAPWTELYLPPRSSRTRWDSLTEVTAIFGYPSVPGAIQRAALELTAILRIQSPRATNQIPEGAEQALDASAEAQKIVSQLSGVYAKPAWIFS